MANNSAPDENSNRAFRRGELLGKYRLGRRVGRGGYGDVWCALDTIEGVQVALKIPYRFPADTKMLADFRREARILSQLDHPNILRLKNADIIGGRLILAYELGLESLEERRQRRQQTRWSLEVARQLLEALSAAHQKKVIHRDVKPENIFLFPGDRIQLGDFCIARMADVKFTHETSSGTPGFMAPEQAYGQPSLASDVFSAGLVLYQLLTGKLPAWPFEWPFPGRETLEAKVPSQMCNLIRKAAAFKAKARYPSATQMLSAYNHALARYRQEERKKITSVQRRRARSGQPRWEAVRVREFEKLFRNRYELRYECRKCGNPVGEAMSFCPWCGTGDNSFRNATHYPAYCPECERGVRTEWAHCPWCYAGRFRDAVQRPHRDARYTRRCANPSCRDRRMTAFMRYCPWCKTKAKRPPKCQENEAPCPQCAWPVPEGFWEICGWCGKDIS